MRIKLPSAITHGHHHRHHALPHHHNCHHPTRSTVPATCTHTAPHFTIPHICHALSCTRLWLYIWLLYQHAGQQLGRHGWKHTYEHSKSGAFDKAYNHINHHPPVASCCQKCTDNALCRCWLYDYLVDQPTNGRCTLFDSCAGPDTTDSQHNIFLGGMRFPGGILFCTCWCIVQLLATFLLLAYCQDLPVIQFTLLHSETARTLALACATEPIPSSSLTVRFLVQQS